VQEELRRRKQQRVTGLLIEHKEGLQEQFKQQHAADKQCEEAMSQQAELKSTVAGLEQRLDHMQLEHEDELGVISDHYSEQVQPLEGDLSDDYDQRVQKLQDELNSQHKEELQQYCDMEQDLQVVAAIGTIILCAW